MKADAKVHLVISGLFCAAAGVFVLLAGPGFSGILQPALGIAAALFVVGATVGRRRKVHLALAVTAIVLGILGTCLVVSSANGRECSAAVLTIICLMSSVADFSVALGSLNP